MNSTIRGPWATIRLAEIQRLEALGFLDPSCPSCQKYEYPFLRDEWQPGMSRPMSPSHKPSPHCESGKRPHCTCDLCF